MKNERWKKNTHTRKEKFTPNQNENKIQAVQQFLKKKTNNKQLNKRKDNQILNSQNLTENASKSSKVRNE